MNRIKIINLKAIEIKMKKIVIQIIILKILKMKDKKVIKMKKEVIPYWNNKEIIFNNNKIKIHFKLKKNNFIHCNLIMNLKLQVKLFKWHIVFHTHLQI